MKEHRKQSLTEERLLKDHIEKVHNRFHKVVAKAWDDDDFKSRLVRDPGTIFEEYGIELPPGVSVNVMENTSEQWNFVLPARCAQISDGPLESSELAASCVCSCCCGYTAALEQQLADT